MPVVPWSIARITRASLTSASRGRSDRSERRVRHLAGEDGRVEVERRSVAAAHVVQQGGPRTFRSGPECPPEVAGPGANPAGRSARRHELARRIVFLPLRAGHAGRRQTHPPSAFRRRHCPEVGHGISPTDRSLRAARMVQGPHDVVSCAVSPGRCPGTTVNSSDRWRDSFAANWRASHRRLRAAVP